MLLLLLDPGHAYKWVGHVVGAAEGTAEGVTVGVAEGS